MKNFIILSVSFDPYQGLISQLPVKKSHYRGHPTFVVNVPDGLGGFEGRVGKPHLPGLLNNFFLRIAVRRVSRYFALDGTRFGRDNPDRDTAQATTTDENRFGPVGLQLQKRTAVQNPKRVARTRQNCPSVVNFSLDGLKLGENITGEGVYKVQPLLTNVP